MLLAASPGTAQAQVQMFDADDTFDMNGLEVDVAKVDEGDGATITVSVKAKSLRQGPTTAPPTPRMKARER